MKVYCKDCKYLKHKIITEPLCSDIFKCGYSDNLKECVFSSWYEEEREITYDKAPEELNKNNDCKWYKKK